MTSGLQDPTAQRPRPRKRFGQHFLEPAWVDKVVRAIAPGPDDRFVEIGPGAGALTSPLAALVQHLVAIEVDRDLVAHLLGRGLPNVTVVSGDVLDVSPADILRAFGPMPPEARLRVAGNLPYNIGAPILFKLIALYELGLPVHDATVMLQIEVVDRIVARPGTHDYGLLSVLLGHVAGVERLLVLPPGAFRPAPKVTSAVLRLRFHPPDPPARHLEAMRSLVRTLFTRRRKTVLNGLLAVPGVSRQVAVQALHSAGVDPVRRPETLDVAEFVALSNGLEATQASTVPFPSR